MPDLKLELIKLDRKKLHAGWAPTIAHPSVSRFATVTFFPVPLNQVDRKDEIHLNLYHSVHAVSKERVPQNAQARCVPRARKSMDRVFMTSHLAEVCWRK